MWIGAGMRESSMWIETEMTKFRTTIRTSASTFIYYELFIHLLAICFIYPGCNCCHGFSQRIHPGKEVFNFLLLFERETGYNTRKKSLMIII